MTLHSRTEWGAAHGDGAPVGVRPVPRVVIHNSGVPDVPEGATFDRVAQHIRAIETDHATNPAKKWSGIGYNWLIDQDGRVWEGRSWGRAGAHAGVGEINRTSVGICFLIDGDKHDASERAWDAAIELIRTGIRQGEIAPGYTLTGHRDHKSTACPGNQIYRQLGRLRGLTLDDPVGTLVYSQKHGPIVVTQYTSDSLWAFVPMSEVVKLPGTLAGSPLSAMPRRPFDG